MSTEAWTAEGRRRLPGRGLILAAVLPLALHGASVPAGADPYLPPAGAGYAGVSLGDPQAFERQTGAHPAVFQSFAAWNDTYRYVFERAERVRARVMVHISTSKGPGTPERITPAAIARGRGDAYAITLGDEIAARGRPVYVRLMAEMNGYWNPYCAYTATGLKRDGEHSTADFRQAWRRTVIILRGGPVEQINRRLATLRLPRVQTSRSVLARAPVAFLWVPQVAGAPNVRGNSPRAYWPGSRYVDWVGTDFYSRFPNWSGLERLYRAFRRKPFALGEWAIWGADDAGFVRRLFRWARRHPRARMLIYNQGAAPSGPFNLARYPRAAAELRTQLRSPRWRFYAPEWQP